MPPAASLIVALAVAILSPGYGFIARLIVVLVLGLFAGPLAAAAQPPTKVPRIGVLAAGIPATYTSRFEANPPPLRGFWAFPGIDRMIL